MFMLNKSRIVFRYSRELSRLSVVRDGFETLVAWYSRILSVISLMNASLSPGCGCLLSRGGILPRLS